MPAPALLRWLVSASLLLAGWAPRDDYYIENDGGYGGGGGADWGAGGTAPDFTSARGGASGVGGTPMPGGDAGIAGAAESETADCVSVTNEDHEYAFCFAPLTQARARANCGERGMTLAVIEDQAEDSWLSSTYSALYEGNSARAFIGANDVATEGEWRWADGTTFWRGGATGAAVSGRYVNWEAGQPSDPGSRTAGSEDCLALVFADGTWDDSSCESELPYVCEPR